MEVINKFLGKKGVYIILLELQKVSVSKINFTSLRKLTKLDDNTISRRLDELKKMELIERHVLNDRSVEYNITTSGKKVFMYLSKISLEIKKNYK